MSLPAEAREDWYARKSRVTRVALLREGLREPRRVRPVTEPEVHFLRRGLQPEEDERRPPWAIASVSASRPAAVAASHPMTSAARPIGLPGATAIQRLIFAIAPGRRDPLLDNVPDWHS